MQQQQFASAINLPSLENILVISSSDISGDLAHGSNFGQETVDFLIPGEGKMEIKWTSKDGKEKKDFEVFNFVCFHHTRDHRNSMFGSHYFKRNLFLNQKNTSIPKLEEL